MTAKTKTLFILFAILSLVITQKASSNIYKLHQEGQTGKHTHISIVNGKKTTVEITKHLLEGSTQHIWFKIIKTEGSPTIAYSKQMASHEWKLLPKGCSAHEPVKAKNLEKCSEGWEIGKMIARTITYLALHKSNGEK